jgi:hypothetical protein
MKASPDLRELVGGVGRVAGRLGGAHSFLDAARLTSVRLRLGLVKLGGRLRDRLFELLQTRRQLRAASFCSALAACSLCDGHRLGPQRWLEGTTSRHAYCSAAITTSVRP